MPSDPESPALRIPAVWLDDVVCPVCQQVLRFGEALVVCVGCGRAYPVVDGIPVLIPDRGMQRDQKPA